MKKIPLIIALFVTASACSSNSHIDTDAIDGLCAGLFPQGQPGAAVLVMKGDEVVFEKCYGLADMETGAGITPEISFNIAAVSKQFTAVAVLQLCEQGKISLDDNVNEYFPEFTNDIWKDIKVKRLLSHSSGIPDAHPRICQSQRLGALPAAPGYRRHCPLSSIRAVRTFLVAADGADNSIAVSLTRFLRLLYAGFVTEFPDGGFQLFLRGL